MALPVSQMFNYQCSWAAAGSRTINDFASDGSFMHVEYVFLHSDPARLSDVEGRNDGWFVQYIHMLSLAESAESFVVFSDIISVQSTSNFCRCFPKIRLRAEN